MSAAHAVGEPHGREPAAPRADVLLRQWLNGIKIQQIAHKQAAAAYHQTGRALGLFVTAGTVVVGTSVFGSVATTNSVGLRIFAGCLSMVVAVASGIQTFLDYPALCAKHRAAALDLGRLRREIEELLVRAGSEELPGILADLRGRWGELEQGAPELPQKFHDRARGQVMPARPEAGAPPAGASGAGA